MSNITAAELRTWLAHAAEGEAITYFHGFLALATQEGDHRRELIRVADYLWRAAQYHRVHLVQVRRGVGDYAYVAIARGCRVPDGSNDEPLAFTGDAGERAR
jgi:hypothetical protein